VDGNNVLAMYDTIKGVREYCIRHQKPYLVEAITFRMRGHEEASGTKYVPPQLFELWKQKDPISNYEQYLLQSGVINEEEVTGLKERFREKIESELATGFQSPATVADEETELNDLY